MLTNLFHEGKASPVGRIVSDCATRNPPSVSRSGGFWCALGNGGCGATLLSDLTVCNQGVMGGAESLNVADEQSAENCAPDRR